MILRSRAKKILRKILQRFGFDVVREVYLYDWQKEERRTDLSEVYLPEGAKTYLSPTNPVLLSYEERYRNCDYPVSDVLLWSKDRVRAEDILYFRGHNAYVFQEGRSNRNIFGYLLAYYYVKSIDYLGLLEKLSEDNAFGAITYEIDGKKVSRDLLDSILEITFLDRHLSLVEKTEFSILDIGAGYGRSAHRMVEAFPGLKNYSCTDAIAVSSFVAEYYLNFRGIEKKAKLLPLDTIKGDIQKNTFYLAINVHSFSECTLTAIEWWLDLLNENRVPYLMIVPNSGTELLTHDKRDFQPLVEKYGYELLVMEPKYKDPVVQKYAMNPDHFHLYKLRL